MFKRLLFIGLLAVVGCKSEPTPETPSPIPAKTVQPSVSIEPVSSTPMAAVSENTRVAVIKDGSAWSEPVPLSAPIGEKVIADANARAVASNSIHPNQTGGMDQVNANSWKSKANWQNVGSQIAYLRYPTKATYGQTIDIRYTVRGNLDWAVKVGSAFVANLKIFRLWPEGTNYVNLYEGQSPGTQECHLFAENMKYIPIPGLSAWQTTHRSMEYFLVKKMFDGHDHIVTRTIKLPSGLGRNDGRWTVTVDGYTALDVTNLQVNDAAHPAIPNVVFIQVDISNHQQPAFAYFNVSDVLVGVR